MPSLLRAALGDDTPPVYTVHRLDAAVSGVMVYARTRHAAADLAARDRARRCAQGISRAVACGALPEQRGELGSAQARPETAQNLSPEAPGRTCGSALPSEVLASRRALALPRPAVHGPCAPDPLSARRAARRSGATQNTAAAGKGISRFFPALSPFRTRSPASC